MVRAHRRKRIQRISGIRESGNSTGMCRAYYETAKAAFLDGQSPTLLLWRVEHGPAERRRMSPIAILVHT